MRYYVRFLQIRSHISYNTGKSVLPDIYAHALEHCANISGNALLPVL